jgi:hypothetical protein
VTPQEDGTMEIRVESIADRTEEYSVSTESYLSSFKLVMKQSQGLLTEVSLTSDSSAVASESIKATGEIKKSKIEAETEATKKAYEKQEAASKEQRDGLKKLQDSLEDAKIELAQAEAALKETKDEAKKEEVAIVKAKANAKVETIKERLGKLGQEGAGEYSKVKENEESKFKAINRPGPVLLLIQEDDQIGPQLIPMNFNNEPQKMFVSYERPQKAVEQKPSEPIKLEFDKTEIDCQLSTTSGKIVITTKNDFESLMAAVMIASCVKVNLNLLPKVKRQNSKTFELEFNKDTPPDSYIIKFLGQIKENSPSVPGEIKVRVTK